MVERQPNSLDVCACGDNREEHIDGGKCTATPPYSGCRCTSFRLACTAEDMMAGWDEWSKICEENGI